GKRFLPFSWPWAAAAVSAAFAAAALGVLALWGDEAPGRTAPERPAASVIERTAVGTPAASATRGSSPSIGNVAPAHASPPATSPAEPPAADRASARGSLAKLLAESAASTDAETAFSVLFSLWNASYDASRGEPCAQAAEAGLKCLYRSTGSIGALRHLDRPAILTLVGADGERHEVVVTRLGYDDVEIAIGERRAEFPLSELTHHWFGDHLILWRPPNLSGALIPGARGEAVVWLRQALARVRGETRPASRSAYDDPRLEADVRRYQREKMLTVDGIVGEMTQLALMSDLGEPDRPTLRGDE